MCIRDSVSTPRRIASCAEKKIQDIKSKIQIPYFTSYTDYFAEMWPFKNRYGNITIIILQIVIF